MSIRVKIELRNVYGETKLYPADRAAEHLANIAGTRTLTRRTIRNALLLGIEVELIGRETIVLGQNDQHRIAEVLG